MANLLQYIQALEPYSADTVGDGTGVLPQPTAQGTGTSGAVGIPALPTLQGEGSASWRPFGLCILPSLQGTGTTNGYHPAWGTLHLPAPTPEGTAHTHIESVDFLPLLFSESHTGAAAEASLPLPSPYALSGYNTRGSGLCVLRLPIVSSWACSLESPLNNTIAVSRVVALLNQGNAILKALAAQLTEYDADNDAKAISVTYAVSHLLTYTSDTSGIGDNWTCAIATWMRAFGDCEDGAILIHALLLAAGVPAARLRTCFGTVGVDRTGHAWTIYQRESDCEWIPLEWTAGPIPWDRTAQDIKRMLDLTATYTGVEYLLTSSDFFKIASLSYARLLMVNHARASIAALFPTASGKTNVSASASLHVLLPTLTGAAGACGSMCSPLPQILATGLQASVGFGDCTLSHPEISGCPGAQGVCSMGMDVLGCGGISGRCAVAVPFPLAVATGGQASSGRGACTIAFDGAGRMLAGLTGEGDCAMPLPLLRGTDLASLVGRGNSRIPLPTVAGQGGALSDGRGHCRIPRLRVRGAAHTTSTPHIWEFVPERLS